MVGIKYLILNERDSKHVTLLPAKNALKIWLMVRHGSRTASTKEIDVFRTMENGVSNLIELFAQKILIEFTDCIVACRNHQKFCE